MSKGLANSWTKHLGGAALAFRGYNQTNLGKTPELLAHPVYGPIVERHLQLASSIHADCTGRATDLVARVREHRESTADSFSEDIALIISVEMAQLELLEQFFDANYRQARLSLGYSLGEITALVAGGTFVVEQVLRPLTMMAADCASLARESAMGILFSRGTLIEPDAVHCLCQEITSEGTGTIAVSSILSPNTLLLIGQGGTLELFKHRMAASLGARLNLKKADGVWPPLHTPILWQRNISNRAGVIMQRMTGGLKTPTPNILSLVTGRMSYTRANARDTIVQWLDHPQRLWDAICEVLGMAIETVVHIGPDPNLVPATFKRLSDNVLAQRASTSFSRWGRSAVSFMARRPWLTPVLSTRAVLLRAPYVEHVILEDWLLAQDVR